MKNLFLLLLTPLLFTSCSKLLGSSGEYTFTGTLYKDCDRTPLANASIVYTTFRGSGFSPLTRSFNSETDATGRFTIKEASDGLQSITIELAQPPEYEAGPVIGRMDAGPVPNDVTHDFGELFATSQGQAGNSRYFTSVNLKISPYYQQKDSLIIGFFGDAPLILSPVPANYKGTIEGRSNGESFAPLTSVSSGTLTWATSMRNYLNPIAPPAAYPNAYKGKTIFSLCGNGSQTDFVVDTFSHN